MPVSIEKLRKFHPDNLTLGELEDGKVMLEQRTRAENSIAEAVRIARDAFIIKPILPDLTAPLLSFAQYDFRKAFWQDQDDQLKAFMQNTAIEAAALRVADITRSFVPKAAGFDWLSDDVGGFKGIAAALDKFARISPLYDAMVLSAATFNGLFEATQRVNGPGTFWGDLVAVRDADPDAARRLARQMD